MKNIFILPTDKPSRLFIDIDNDKLTISNNSIGGQYFMNQNIYLTSDEEIKDVRPHKGKWQLEKSQILNKFPNYLTDLSECKLIIMTTDQDLIKDGVQEIDNEFLEWIIKNPSCESVEVTYNYEKYLETIEELKDSIGITPQLTKLKKVYKVIIPKEEYKQFVKCRCNNGLQAENCIMNCGHGQELSEEKAEAYARKIWGEYYDNEYDTGMDLTYGEACKNDFLAGMEWQKEQCEKELDEHLEVTKDLCLQLARKNKNLYTEDDLKDFGTFIRIEDHKPDRMFLTQDYFELWLKRNKI